jgi:hypothetical protein
VSKRMDELVALAEQVSGTHAAGWVVRDGQLHLTCGECGQSMFRVTAGLSFTLAGAAVHFAAHLRQCHDG